MRIMKDYTHSNFGKRVTALLGSVSAIGFTAIAVAAAPVVKTVRWDPNNPVTPHDTYSGKQITLKGTCNTNGVNIQYIWNFGDGSPPVTGTVTDQYDIQATHV